MSTAVCMSGPAATVSKPMPDFLRRTGAALAIQPLHVVCLLASVSAFSGWLFAECAALPFLAVVFFVLFALNAYYLGRLLLRVVPLANRLRCSFPLIFLTGSLLWALVLFGMHSLLPGSLRGQTLLLFALTISGQFLGGRTVRSAPREKRSAAWVSLFVVLFSLAAATCWARGLLHSTRPGEDSIQFRHSMDYFDHAAFTAQFLAPEHLWQFGNDEISGLPTPLYHYGNYLYPAALASFSRLSAYNVVVAFWTPFGTFLSGLAAYVLVLSFGGRRAALCALIALLALPDASAYAFRNGVFGYHWRQQMSAGGLYGVACAALALLGLIEARRCRSWMALLFTFGFGAATFFFKAQIFVVLMPLLVLWFILCYPRFSVAWRIHLVQGMAVLALGGIFLSNKLHLGPTIAPDREFFENYCQFVTKEGNSGRLGAIVAKGTAAVGRSRFYLAATSLVLLSTLGALAGVLPILCIGAWWRKKLQAVDLAPWLVVFLYALVLVGLNDSFLGVYPWELIHRPFVWTYYLVLVWCAGKAGLLLGDFAWGRWLLNGKRLAVVGTVLLVLPWQMGRSVQEGTLSGRYQHCNLSFSRGLVECGRYVAHSGSRCDLVQDSQYDGHLVFGSLSERRSYLARPQLWKRSKNPAVPAEIERRLALLEKLKTLTTVEEIQAVAAQTGIRWYLLHPDDPVSWPQEILANPAFRSQGFAVYDLSKKG